ncbi:MAG: PHP domain-containing protein [Dehalococcoidia bacterium]|nr:PHP domain-containing protein [Dehalococcoidia bacterium]
MPGVDLHLHTTASDGALSPHDLIARCHEAGLRVVAITDHDSTEAVAAATAAAATRGMVVVPGTELSTDFAADELHMLGYFVDVGDPTFQDTLLGMRDSRVGRAKEMVRKLNELGLPLDWERVQAIAGDGAIGRPHVAQAMVEAGHVQTIAEAFERWIGRDGPAYAERVRLSPAECVALIRRVGGLPVLAHPRDLPDLAAIVADLARVGLAGIEVYYGGHQPYTPDEQEALLALAQRHNLIPTGGTDFHGNGNWHEPHPGFVDVPWSVAERLFAAAGRPLPV